MGLCRYGSYGSSEDPTFDYKRTCLLDRYSTTSLSRGSSGQAVMAQYTLIINISHCRGVIFAIAHIRGGGEMGRSWYEDQGKYLTKRNTFNDFADCARYLASSGVCLPTQLAAVGRSAGGLLMGVMANEHAHLFQAIVADVPFVDVINTSKHSKIQRRRCNRFTVCSCFVAVSDPTIPLTVTEW
jgi:protease II